MVNQHQMWIKVHILSIESRLFANLELVKACSKCCAVTMKRHGQPEMKLNEFLQAPQKQNGSGL